MRHLRPWHSPACGMCHINANSHPNTLTATAPQPPLAAPPPPNSNCCGAEHRLRPLMPLESGGTSDPVTAQHVECVTSMQTAIQTLSPPPPRSALSPRRHRQTQTAVALNTGCAL